MRGQPLIGHYYRSKPRLLIAFIVAFVAVTVIGCDRQANDIDSHELARFVISEEQAVAIALDWAAMGAPGISPVESPRVLRAELMREHEFAELEGGEGGVARNIGDPVWVVELAGTSWSTRVRVTPGPESTYAYATIILNAQTGDLKGQRRSHAPLLE